ncbi:hypothetical protein MTO96_022258 [Rhipicephalus appendiculatus]
MCYTEATLYEVMRVVNSPIIPHVCSNDTTIQGFHVNRGTVVMFLSDDGQYVLKPGHFFPFGTGKRSCMGDGLVRATLILGLATLLGRFELSLAPGQEPARFKDFRSKVIFDSDPKIVFTELAARTQCP